jgi:hypothetical protein
MESIQCLNLQDSPLEALAQQGVETVVQIAVAEPSMGNRRGEPSVKNQSDDRAKCAWIKEASLASDDKRLADDDAYRWITQNPWQCEHYRDPADIRNAIDARRHNRAQRLLGSARQCEPPTPSVRGTFCALARLSSGRLPGQTSSSLGVSINIMGLAILKNSFRCTI